MHCETMRRVTRRRTGQAIGVALGILLFACPARALRCHGGLVSLGDHQVEVLERCGEPVFVARRTEYPYVGWTAVRTDGDAGTDTDARMYGHADVASEHLIRVVNLPVQVEEWVYDLGSRRFRQLLRFHSGRLVEIESIANLLALQIAGAKYSI